MSHLTPCRSVLLSREAHLLKQSGVRHGRLHRLTARGRQGAGRGDGRDGTLRSARGQHEAGQRRPGSGPQSFPRPQGHRPVPGALPATEDLTAAAGDGMATAGIQKEKRELRLPTSLQHNTPTLKKLAAYFEGKRELPL